MTKRRFFFVHVMKTGGATLRQHIRANFRRRQVYPDRCRDGDTHGANVRIDDLLDLAPERRAQLRVYTGHFPYMVTELLDEDLITLTMLRHPVDRTISFLKSSQRSERFRDATFEEIYEHPKRFRFLIHDHQAKMFSLRPEDQPTSLYTPIKVDSGRLALACENLEQVDAIGLQERSGEFHQHLTDRFGWNFTKRVDQRVGDATIEISQAFRDRIAEDNAADMAFYEHACRVYRARRGARA